MTVEGDLYVARFESLQNLDDYRAQAALDQVGDPALAAVWLALDLDELDGLSPLEAWRSGRKGQVRRALERM